VIASQHATRDYVASPTDLVRPTLLIAKKTRATATARDELPPELAPREGREGGCVALGAISTTSVR